MTSSLGKPMLIISFTALSSSEPVTKPVVPNPVPVDDEAAAAGALAADAPAGAAVLAVDGAAVAGVAAAESVLLAGASTGFAASSALGAGVAAAG